MRLTIPVPIFGDNENIRFEIREDGRTLERFNYTGFQSNSRPGDASALIVADPAKRVWNDDGELAETDERFDGFVGLRRLTAGGQRWDGWHASGASGTPPPLDFLLAPARLPTNWLGYTSLRAVIIGPEEWEQLNDAQKNALLTWTACGGDLIFVDGDLSALFPGDDAGASSAGGGRSRGSRLFLRPNSPADVGVRRRRRACTDVLSAAAKVQDANWALPANSARDWGVIAARGFRLPIPGVDGVPARAYVSILIVFSILIGPVNYWFLRRKRPAGACWC